VPQPSEAGGAAFIILLRSSHPKVRIARITSIARIMCIVRIVRKRPVPDF